MAVTFKIFRDLMCIIWEITTAFFSFVWDYIFDRRFRRSIIALWTEKLP